MNYLKELLCELRSSLPLTVLLVLLLCLDLAVAGITFGNYRSAEDRAGRYEPVFTSRQEYKVIDLIEDGDLSDLYRDETLLENQEQMYRELAANPGIKPVEKTVQPLYVADFQGSERCSISYEQNGRMETARIEGVSYSAVNQLTVSQTVLDLYGLRLEEGSFFDGWSFDRSSQEIPVLLGSGYRGAYEVGDRFEGKWLFLHHRFRVAGILSPDQAIPCGDELISLDDRILTPAYQSSAPPSQEELFFRIERNFQRIAGYYQLSDGYSPEQFSRDLEALRVKYGLPEFSVARVDGSAARLLGLTVYMDLGTMSAVAVLLTALSLASFFALFLVKSRLSRRRYAVHLLCGASKFQICLLLSLECAALWLISLAAVLCVLLPLGVSPLHPAFAGCCVLLLLLVAAQPFFTFTRLDLDSLIRRNE